VVVVFFFFPAKLSECFFRHFFYGFYSNSGPFSSFFDSFSAFSKHLARDRADTAVAEALEVHHNAVGIHREHLVANRDPALFTHWGVGD
jgi:hypothetical protein